MSGIPENNVKSKCALFEKWLTTQADSSQKGMARAQRPPPPRRSLSQNDVILVARQVDLILRQEKLEKEKEKEEIRGRSFTAAPPPSACRSPPMGRFRALTKVESVIQDKASPGLAKKWSNIGFRFPKEKPSLVSSPIKTEISPIPDEINRSLEVKLKQDISESKQNIQYIRKLIRQIENLCAEGGIATTFPLVNLLSQFKSYLADIQKSASIDFYKCLLSEPGCEVLIERAGKLQSYLASLSELVAILESLNSLLQEDDTEILNTESTEQKLPKERFLCHLTLFTPEYLETFQKQLLALEYAPLGYDIQVAATIRNIESIYLSLRSLCATLDQLNILTLGIAKNGNPHFVKITQGENTELLFSGNLFSKITEAAEQQRKFLNELKACVRPLETLDLPIPLHFDNLDTAYADLLGVWDRPLQNTEYKTLRLPEKEKGSSAHLPKSPRAVRQFLAAPLRKLSNIAAKSKDKEREKKAKSEPETPSPPISPRGDQSHILAKQLSSNADECRKSLAHLSQLVESFARLQSSKMQLHGLSYLNGELHKKRVKAQQDVLKMIKTDPFLDRRQNRKKLAKELSLKIVEFIDITTQIEKLLQNESIEIVELIDGAAKGCIDKTPILEGLIFFNAHFNENFAHTIKKLGPALHKDSGKLTGILDSFHTFYKAWNRLAVSYIRCMGLRSFDLLENKERCRITLMGRDGKLSEKFAASFLETLPREPSQQTGIVAELISNEEKFEELTQKSSPQGSCPTKTYLTEFKQLLSFINNVEGEINNHLSYFQK